MNTPDTHMNSHVVSPPFTVESIEAQIHQAWSELGAIAEKSGAPAPLRTSILTLAVIACGDLEIGRANRTLEQLIQVLPSRVIQISVRDSTAELSATVSAHCAITRSEQASCYEIIRIEAGPDDMRAVPSILTQLDISDLTTFVWWVGPVDTRLENFRRIAGSSERVVFDSSKSRQPLDDLVAYNRFLTENQDVIAGTDLTWSRMLAMRELVAQSFDHPAAVEMLDNIQRVDMTYEPAARAGILLMAGWLSSRLGWTPTEASESGETIQLTVVTNNDRRVTFNLSAAQGSSIGLHSVRILAHTGTSSSRVTVRRIDAGRAIVNLQMTALPRQERIVHCAEGNDDQVLGMELLQFSRDLIYEAALEQAAAFAAMLLDNKGGR